MEFWKSEILKKPKLRTYCLIKKEFETEKYVKLNLSRAQRSLLAQLRFSILPIHIETGRFRGLDVKFRLCQFCNVIEDELHFLFSCKEYESIRKSFLSDLDIVLDGSQADIFSLLCNDYPRKLSKYVCEIWSKRKELMYN